MPPMGVKISYTIAQFCFLRHLLLMHCHWSYMCNGNMFIAVLYNIYFFTMWAWLIAMGPVSWQGEVVQFDPV